jgi:hypothetical protein
MKIVFGKERCKGCKEACKALEGDGIEYKFVPVDYDNVLDADMLAMGVYYGVFNFDAVYPIIIDDKEYLELTKSRQKKGWE